MCDYSVVCSASRLTVEGEQLTVHRFPTGTLGLASLCPGLKEFLLPASTPAVCVPPVARLLLRDIPGSSQWRFGVGGVEEVTFVEQSAGRFSDRDALRLANGRELSLHHLGSVQRVEVLGRC